jgi:hypothetical protein
MARLSPAELRTRLALDYRVIRGTRPECLGQVRPFVSHEALVAGTEATQSEGEAGRVEFYTVAYRFPVLIGAGRTTPKVTVMFDLLAGGNYPFGVPAATCVGAPFPWSPHFHPTSGAVCLGGCWREAHGRMLAGQLVVHVARLLNFDEPDREGYGGWNPPAVQYWRSVLGTRPLHPNLRYPILPADVTHAVDDANCGFRASDRLQAPDGFLASGPVFSPVQSDMTFLPVVDGDSGGLRPLGGAQ